MRKIIIYQASLPDLIGQSRPWIPPVKPGDDDHGNRVRCEFNGLTTMHKKHFQKKAASFLLPFIIFLLLSHVYAGNKPSPQKGFLWKIQSKTGTAYVVGSIHAYTSELYPLPKKMEDAFDNSDALAVEANVNEIKPESMMTMINGALYQDRSTLEKHLSSETYEMTVQKLKELGLPLEIFQNTKPWFVALTLTSLELQKLGLDPEYGIDNYFLKKAENRKRVVELESIEYQVNLLSSFSDTEQELFLVSTLKDLDLLKKEINTILTAWNTGDTKTMESFVSKSLQDDPGMLPIYKKLVFDRNKNMASKIEGYLKTNVQFCVVVGAAHLVGKDGIIEILKRKGYIVEQL
jgi:uncharacterized protein YbaP (TraB family)